MVVCGLGHVDSFKSLKWSCIASMGCIAWSRCMHNDARYKKSGMCAQVMTSHDEFASVRDKLQGMGLTVDHDHSGLVFAPLTTVEVRTRSIQYSRSYRSYKKEYGVKVVMQSVSANGSMGLKLHSRVKK